MKRKLFLFLCALLTSVGMWATDYLTNFSDYTVTKTAVSNDATSGTAREFWRNAILGFDVYGSSTTIPNGVYSFSMQGMYRGHLTGDIPTGIIAYAESDGAQYMAPICNKTDGTVEAISLAGFNTAFNNDANNYLNKIPYIIVADGKIKVGVKSMSTQPFCDNGMWFVFNTASFKVSDVTDGSVLSTALSDIKAQAAGLLGANSDESTERSNLQTAYNSATATAADIVNVKQKIDAYLAYLSSSATSENPKDVSWYFTNPKYSIRNLDLVGGLVTSGKSGALGQPFGWTCFDAGGTGDNGSGNAFQDGQGFNWFSTIGNTTVLDGQAANYDAEKTGGFSIYQRISWNQWAEQTHSAKQTTTLPLGKYKISVPAYASAKNDDYKGYVIFNVGGTEYSNEVTAGSWNVYEKEFIITEPTEISVDMQFNKLRRAQNVGKQYAYFDGVTITSYGDPLKDLKEELAALQGSIDDDYLNNSTYNNVVGVERTNLSAAKTATASEETAEAYQTVINNVENTINIFVAAKPNYDALVAEIAKATALGMDASGYAATSSSTAASALTSTQNLKVAEYTYVTTTYQYGVSLGEWTTTGPTGSLSEQHYKGAGYPYLEQSAAAWGQSSWTIKYAQDLRLPTGNYVFKVAGRQADSDGVTLSLTVKSGETVLGTVADFPRGDVGLGINKNGVTSFNPEDAAEFVYDGKGRGWEWRYVKFTLASDATVNVSVDAVATIAHMWVSFCDATVQTDDDANISLIAYNIALGSAKTIIADETYENVTGSEKTELQAAIDADEDLDKTDKDAIDAAKDNLETKTSAFTSVKSTYDTYVAAKAVEYPNDKPYASAAKYAAIGIAQAAGDATSASDAEAKTAAIISAYRQYVESHALAEGVTGAENKTNLISDPNFAGVTISEMTAGGWTFTQGGGTAQITNSQSFTDGDGNHNYSYFDYANNDNNNQHITQTINNLPAGQYWLTVTARAQSNFNDYFFLKVTDGENNVSEKIPAIGNSGGTFDGGWNDVNLRFVHTTDGNITIEVYSDGGSGSGKRAGWWSATRFRLVRLGDATVSKTITSAKWATYCSPYALDFSSSIENLTAAYIITGLDEKGALTLEEVTETVPAETGLLLKGNGECVIPVAVSGSKDVSSNKLVGVTSSQSLPAEEGYVLMGSPKVGFYKNTKAFTLGANTAYLPDGFDSVGPGARAAFYGFDEDDAPTAINAIEAADAKGNGLKDGKYLIGGKIVMVKNNVKYNANGQILR